MKKTTSGFTIVELLIVIVVIAILAVITIVAYNGIQNRANDSTIQSDLVNYSKKAELFNVDNGRYPGSQAELATLGVKASQGAYNTSYYNLYYCTQVTTNDRYIFAGRSKSGIVYYTSSKGIGNLGNINMSATPICNVVGATYGTDATVFTGLSNTGVWSTWAQ